MTVSCIRINLLTFLPSTKHSKMAKLSAISPKKNAITFCLLLLIASLGSRISARILNEVDPQPILADAPDEVVPPMEGTLPSGQFPVTDDEPLPEPSTDLPEPEVPIVSPEIVTPPVVAVTPPVAAVTPPVAAVTPPVVANVAPIATPVAMSPSGTTTVPAAAAVVNVAEHAQLSFFMHDILGGTHPSGRVVTGIVANSDVNNLPFSKANNQVFPISGGVPLNTVNGIINNNNAPLLVGLNGSPSNTVVQNNGNNNVAQNGNSLPFVSAGQLPSGLTLQQLMFGSITVVDNEITEGHELDSAVLGKVQGFYLSSSLDGTSHTLVLTALFHGGEHDVDDTVSVFGIHRTGSPVSEIAVIGGTGKYEDAKGYASIEALPQQDQHTTDGVETITQFNVYLTA